jgi:hypothetical protein
VDRTVCLCSSDLCNLQLPVWTEERPEGTQVFCRNIIVMTLVLVSPTPLLPQVQVAVVLCLLLLCLFMVCTAVYFHTRYRPTYT